MRTRASAAAVAMAIALGGGSWATAAAAEPPDAPTAGVAAAKAPDTITLLTGDVVTVSYAADGSSQAEVRPGPGREHMAFFQQREGEHLYVLPRDVAGLVPSRLDRALFDVTGLVRAGYDDASRDSLPVIVQAAEVAGAGARAAAGPDWAVAGLSPDLKLESVGAVADTLPRERAAKLLDALAPTEQAGERVAATATAASIEHVWLDRPVQVSDADSMPQIGAPQAWESGFTGEGVTVAVLDTGIDATHPDLDEVMVGERDFTGTGSVADGHGHGTHVASILAGSGDASDGVNRGVAPDADLLIGKVLDDDGSGSTSGIIEGMEWAAEQGADVVNLSLGSADAFADSPDALAVGELTARYGTLFVVAAGNDGYYGEGTVGSPGIAEAALTVGAVDDGDHVTDFSSLGGGLSALLKPDVVAPGDGIVAARAAGTALGEAVDDQHVALSGTSMATPHVAGAVAVLKQARPDLDAAGLKAALMASAQPTGASVFAEGAGRITLPGAIAQPVTASPAALSLGAFEWPHDGESATRTLTYTNTGTDDVTLTLTADATDVSGQSLAGAISLSASSVRVLAGATASVDVTVPDTAGVLGAIGGTVVATATDGTTVRTPLGWAKERELVDLTVRATGRDGEPLTGDMVWGAVLRLDTEDSGPDGALLRFQDGVATARVAPGTYLPVVLVENYDADGNTTDALYLSSAQVDATAGADVVLDGTTAESVTTSTKRPAELVTTSISADVEDETAWGSLGVFVKYGPDTDVALTPVPAPTLGDFDTILQATLLAPTTGDQTAGYRYDLAHHSEGVEVPALVGDASHTVAVETSYGASVGDTHLAERMYWHDGGLIVGGARELVPVGTKRTEYLTVGPGEWRLVSEIQEDGVPVVLAEATARSWATPGKAAQGLVAGVLSPSPAVFGGVQQWGNELHTYPYGRSDSEGGVLWGSDIAQSVRVWQDGEPVDPDSIVEIPEGGADYRLAFESTAGDPAYRLATSVTAEWEFRARRDDAAFAYPPVLDAVFDVRGMNAAGAAPRRAAVRLTVGHTGEAYDTSAVEGARLWWSSDDGATWHEAKVTADGEGVFDARISAPRGTEHVSLKVEARDAAGGTVTETVIRAYAVG